ncbi:MAG: DUF551 domain-containing protein [Candidatus Peribacteraceae bacterium]|nr:DUF551 domain-containing protein [Candidatus Peribacteraceae bacterium]
METNKTGIPVFSEPFETNCDPCYAPDCPHTKQCIKRLQAELDKHRWIPVEEKLPKGANVLVCWESGNISQAICADWEFSAMGGDRITHWKPIILPEAKND